MSLVRFILFLLGVFAIIFMLAFLLPSKVTVAKSVDVNASPEAIKREIVQFSEWKKWYPAFQDGTVAVTKKRPAAGIISSVTLTDKQGNVILLNLTDTLGNTITFNVASASSTRVQYQFLLIPKKHNQTQVTWDVNIDLGWYPWKRIEGIFFDKFSGDQYEAALDDLRKAAEN